MTDRALLTFSLGPVQSFISQARRVADLWAGSDLLSHLVETAIGELGRQGGSLVFPAAKLDELPQGLPNRFVAEVPFATAAEVAQAMEKAVRAEWDRLVGQTVGLLAAEPYEFSISPKIWQAQGWDRQTDTLFEIAWSFVPLGDDYAAASRAGAELFAASRQFRPFLPIEEALDKCAVCGERTALPNGVRGDVKSAWQHAAAQPGDDERFFRAFQTRLCLVCATKRLTPKFTDRRRAQFYSFQEFEPQPVKAEGQQRHDERFPYFALVALDGDKVGLRRPMNSMGSCERRMLSESPRRCRWDCDDERRRRQLGGEHLGIAQKLFVGLRLAVGALREVVTNSSESPRRCWWDCLPLGPPSSSSALC